MPHLTFVQLRSANSPYETDADLPSLMPTVRSAGEFLVRGSSASFDDAAQIVICLRRSSMASRRHQSSEDPVQTVPWLQQGRSS